MKKKVDYSKKLKNRQYEAFCQYHHACKNATQAAIDAGYAVKSAKSKGSQLLTIVNIKGRADYLAEQVAKKCKVTAESVVIDIVDTHRRAKGEDDYNAELKASDMLMKHVGGYEKDNQIGITDDLAGLIKDICGAGEGIPIKESNTE